MTKASQTELLILESRLDYYYKILGNNLTFKQGRQALAYIQELEKKKLVLLEKQGELK